MNSLNKKAQKNLDILFNLDKDDNLIANNGSINIQDDYVQIENTTEIEYAIYFTFNQLLFLTDYQNIYQYDILSKIDQAIDSMYDNNQCNKLLGTDNFKPIIEDIDRKLDSIKEYLYYGSPFFTCFKNIYLFNRYIKNIYNENNTFIDKLIKSSHSNDDYCNYNDQTNNDQTNNDQTNNDDTNDDDSNDDDSNDDDSNDDKEKNE